LGLGRGTELYPLADIARSPILVVAPGVHVATGPAYQALDRGLTFTGMSSSINGFQAFVRTLGELGPAGAVRTFGANDFESVVLTQYPQLKTIQGKLRKCGAAVRMTGSGSAFFAIFESEEERKRAQAALEGDRALQGARVMPARLVNRAGYLKLWRRQLAPYLASAKEERYKRWPPRSR
jgi:4-diphosphocytidyl-2C-methyl-D-erythritol kinase